MALDASIAQGFRPIQVDSPVNALAQVLQVQNMQRQNALAQLQMSDIVEQRKLAVQKAQEELAQAAALRQARQSLPSPQMVANQRALAQGGGPTQAAAQSVRPVDPQAMAIFQAIQAGLAPMDKYADITSRDYGRPEIASWQERAGANGRPEKVGMTKFGDQASVPLPQPVKLETMDLGGNVALRDPYAGTPGQQFTKTMTQAERDASARGWAGLNQPKFDPATGTIFDPRTRTVTNAVGPDGKPINNNKPLPEGAQKQIIGARNLQDAVGNYLDKLRGWSNMDMLKPDSRAEMGNAYNNMMLQAKEAYNLGVLNGPDYSILQSVVKDPTKWDSALVSNEALGNQARELARIASSIEKTSLESHGKQYTPRQKPPAISIDTSAGVPKVKFLGFE